MEHLPVLAAAFAAGAVTAEQAAVTGRVAEPEHRAATAEQGIDLAAVDAVLIDVAISRPHADVAGAVHHYLERLDPDGPEPDPTGGRRLVLARHADGSITGRLDLDAVGAKRLQAALESLVQAGSTPPPARPPREPGSARRSPPRGPAGWPATGR